MQVTVKLKPVACVSGDHVYAMHIYVFECVCVCAIRLIYECFSLQPTCINSQQLETGILGTC